MPAMVEAAFAEPDDLDFFFDFFLSCCYVSKAILDRCVLSEEGKSLPLAIPREV